MVSNGRSSLQKAAAEISGNRGSSCAPNNDRGNKTVTAIQIGAGVSSSSVLPTANASSASRTTSRQRSENLGPSASYKVGEYEQLQPPHLTPPTLAPVHRSSNGRNPTKTTKHFTIISSYDENHQNELQESSESAFMDVEHSSEYHTMHLDDEVPKPLTSSSSSRFLTKTQTFCQIGGMDISEEKNITNFDVQDDREIVQMEGVIDQGTKMPLVVLDGANVAYAYGKAAMEINGGQESLASTTKTEPDARGIQIATDYFLQAGLRALVVLPQYWFKEGRLSGASTATLTPQAEILAELKTKGLVVASPPTDDDDAYALTIARREESRSLKAPRNGEGPGYVLSNDMFRDAQGRDASQNLTEWLNDGRNEDVGPGRISYTFGDMGTMNDRGERILDFVPNPRHPLVIWMEQKG